MILFKMIMAVLSNCHKKYEKYGHNKVGEEGTFV